jgi:hypothetical protein
VRKVLESPRQPLGFFQAKKEGGKKKKKKKGRQQLARSKKHHFCAAVYNQKPNTLVEQKILIYL